MRWLLCLALVGSCVACGAAPDPPADAYTRPVLACEIMPDETVATVTRHLPMVARPVVVAPTTDRFSECRREFEDPEFTLWVTVRVTRLEAEDGRTGAERARRWLRGYGTDPADPRTAGELGFDAVSLGRQANAAVLYATDSNATIVIEYGHTPKASTPRDDLPGNDDELSRHATLRLAPEVAAGLHRYRTG